MVMISALLLLVVATILAVSMFRSFGIEEKIAGNVRDKQRALHAAESAQQYAEWWLSSGNAPSAGDCTDIVSSEVGQVCSNALADPTLVSSWTAGVTYVPPDPSTGSSMQLNGANGPGPATYYKAPMFYIYDMGSGQGGEVYKIDAIGYGGTQNTVAVVESTYVLKSPGYNPDPGA
jgi:type IV pilus assembly protein PilX